VVLLGFLYGLVRGRFDNELTSLLGVSPAFLPLSYIVGMLIVGATLGGMTAWLSLRKAVKA
jgi:cell division transport system permease protein